MSRLRSSVLLAIVLCCCLDGIAQRNFDGAKIKAQKVAGTIWMLEGVGGNIGVSSGTDGKLMIDDQFAGLSSKIQNKLDELGNGSLKFLINTHWHDDHTGGNAAFGRTAPIIAHINVRNRLKAGRGGSAAAPIEALPVLTFTKSISVHFNGEEIKIIHFPKGHTDGDSAIFFTKSNVVHMGDMFFSGRFPYVDLASGGSLAGLIANVAKIIEQTDDKTKIIPGHGPLSSRKDLKLYHEMLVSTRDLVKRKVAAGKSKSAIKSEGLPAKWKSWGEVFISESRWIDLLYSSVSS